MKKLFQSKIFRGIVAGIGFFIILLFVFKAGEMVGFRKAQFSYRWGENYEKNFGAPPRSFPLDARGGGFVPGHGIVGKILTINSSTIAIQEKSGTEQVALLTSSTAIRRMRETISAADLSINDFVVVIGSPNEAGQVAARLIRIMPAPPQNDPSSPAIFPPPSY